MSETKKLYAICVRKDFIHNWTLAVDTETGQPIATTIGHLVDEDLGNWLKETEVLMKVTRKEFFDDLKQDPVNSKYVKMLGWNYAKACRLVEKDGAVFILVTHPAWEAHPYSFAQARDNNDYAFRLLRDVYSIRGGDIILEEFDPEKHVKGYKPDVEYKPKV
jgi:hypothetical protein